MFCGNCGHQIPEGSKFCLNCGSKVPEAAEQVVSPVEEIQAEQEAVLEAPQTEAVEEVTEEVPQLEEPVQQVVEEEPQIEEPVQQVAEEIPQQVTAPQMQMPQDVQPAPVAQATVVAEAVVPTPAVAPEKPVKKEKKFVRGLLSVLCCIMIFVFTTVTMTVFVARQSISENRIEKVFDSIDIEKIEEMSLGDEDEGSIGDLFEGGNGELSGKQKNKLFHKTGIKDFVVGVTVEYANYILGGDEPEGVEAEDIVDLIEENRREIEKITDVKIDSRMLADIEDYFEDEGEDILGFASAEVRTNDAIDGVRIAISIYVLIGLAVLTLLFVFLLLKARKFRLDSLIWISVPLIISGVVLALTLAVKPIILSVGGFENGVDTIVEIILDNIHIVLYITLLTFFPYNQIPLSDKGYYK